MGVGRIWLDVPFADKDRAKAAGARWDPEVRRWYAPRAGILALSTWRARPSVPELLPGEDREFGAGLFVDLVPSSCWFTNVRSCVDASDWERLRRMIVGRAGRRCEICGAPENRESARWLEAHERWSYDEESGVQRLRRLLCLCTDCHESTHFGLASVRGRDHAALAHLSAVTGMSPTEARAHVATAERTWRRRSRTDWTLDLSILTGAGITPSPPPEPRQRRAEARTIGTDHFHHGIN